MLSSRLRFRNHEVKRWSLNALEPRLMLAGDVQVDVASTAAVAAPLAEGNPSTPQLDIAEATEVESVIFIDAGVEDLEMLRTAAASDAEIVLIDQGSDGVEQMTHHLQQRRSVRAVHLVTHGSEGAIHFGNQTLSAENVGQYSEQLRTWRKSFGRDADILLYGCETGKGSQGDQLMQAIAHLTGADVAASDDVTGSQMTGADWQLERSIGTIDAALAFRMDALADYSSQLGITIRAAGSTGEENMQLEVNGQVVQSYSMAGTNAANGQFGDFNYNVDGIDVNSVRVRFTNDLFDPDNGIDRNLRVDFISVDGTVYQSEDPSVFSTGTWQPGGIQPGFRQSEYLHGNGYFQYAGDPPDVDPPDVDPPDVDPPGGTTLVDFDSFDSAAGLQLNGDAVVIGGELRLVAAAAQQRGSTYYTTPISVDADTSFEATFAARFTGGQGSAGGEGLAFVIQNSPAGTSAQNIGNYSGGLDYNAVPNSIGIELDTFKNVYEQFADELTITVNGVLVTPVATTASPFDLNNGQTYNVWVDYDGGSDLLSVFISNDDAKPGSAALTASLRLDQIVGNQAYLGFAAATGTAFNNAYIESWNVTVDGADPPQPDPGDFVLSSSSVNVNENAGSLTINVQRVGGSDGAASVNYFTSSGTAIGDSDYDSISGTLNFLAGQTSKSLTIDVFDDGDDEGNESFTLNLAGTTGGAGLGSPQTATITIIDNDGSIVPGVVNYGSFNSSAGLQLNGNATVTGGELRLVAAAAQQRGSAYYTTPISVDAETSFQTQFEARFDGGQGSAGGEGLAFVIQNSPAGTSAQNIGNYSGGLDYNALPNSIGIELDTFKNGYEQFADEITITVNGVLVTPVATIASPFDLNNGQTYNVWVDYDGATDLLSVFLSDNNQKPGSAVLTANLQLNQIVGDQAYVGFAAATGTAFNNAYIESWSLTATGAEPPGPNPGSILLATDSVSGIENGGPVSIDIARVGGSSGEVTVFYQSFNDTATAGSDYGAVSGSVVFADGETSKTVTMNLFNDDDIEGTESFSFRLLSSNGANLLTPRTATINIIDDDANLPVYNSFNSSAGLQLNGNAVVTGGDLRLVAAAAQQRGSTYYATPISVDSSTSFQSSFVARFDGGQGSGGGEGLAFVIQNSPAGPAAAEHRQLLRRSGL